MGDPRGDSASKQLDSSPDGVESRRKKAKIPDRKNYDEEMEAIIRQIKQKEEKLNSITAVRPDSGNDSGVGGKREALLANLRQLKARREAVLEERRKVDQQLQQANINVQKRREALTKVQSGLKYKSEQQVDDAIKKLEQQLQNQTQRLSLSEEKRLVSEISTLKASKRGIQEYVTQREKIESERAQQNKLRDEREEFFKQLSGIRQEEDQIKTQLDGMKGKQDQAWTEFKQRLSEKDAVRKEIDELYTRKKELVAQNKKQMDVYYEGMRAQRKARREEELKRKEEDRRVAQEAHQKEMSEYLKMREPYKQERDLCTALIAYVTPLGAGSVTGAGGSAAAESLDKDRLAPVRSDDMSSYQGMYRKKKDDDMALGGLFSGSSKGKKGKKGRKGASTQKSSRPLNHNPAIFDQFLSLGLRAPNSSSDVQDVLRQLTDKKTYFETLAAQEKAAESQQRVDESVSEEGADQEPQEPVLDEDASEDVVAVEEQSDAKQEEQANDDEQVEKEMNTDEKKEDNVVPTNEEETNEPESVEAEDSKPEEREEKTEEHVVEQEDVASEGIEEQGGEVEVQAEAEQAVWECEAIDEVVTTITLCVEDEDEEEVAEQENSLELDQDDRQSNGNAKVKDTNVGKPIEIQDVKDTSELEDLQAVGALEQSVEDKQGDEPIVIKDESQTVNDRDCDGDKPQSTGSILTDESLQSEGIELSHREEVQSAEVKIDVSSISQIGVPLEAPPIEEDVSPEVEHAKTEVIDDVVPTENVKQIKTDEEQDVQHIPRSIVPVPDDDGILTANDVEEITTVDISQHEQASTDLEGFLQEETCVESVDATDKDNDAEVGQLVGMGNSKESQNELATVNGDAQSHASPTEDAHHIMDSSKELELALAIEIDHEISSDNHQDESRHQMSSDVGNGSGQEVSSLSVTEETVAKVETLQHHSSDGVIDDTSTGGEPEFEKEGGIRLGETVKALVSADDDGAGSGTEV